MTLLMLQHSLPESPAISHWAWQHRRGKLKVTPRAGDEASGTPSRKHLAKSSMAQRQTLRVITWPIFQKTST